MQRENFLQRIIWEENDCWTWTGKIDVHGYGIVYFKAGDQKAHRVSYESFIGAIKEGFILNHVCHDTDENCFAGRCHHRRCVNPLHLQVTTLAENVRTGKSIASLTRTNMVCQRGHELSGYNLITIQATGAIRCRLCHNAGQVRRRNENKAKLHTNVREVPRTI